MKRRIQHLESYFQICGIVGVIFVVAGALPDFRDQRTALQVASGALLFPALIGAFLLRRLKRLFVSEAAEARHENNAEPGSGPNAGQQRSGK